MANIGSGKGKVFVILLIVLLLAIGGVGGVIAVKNSQSKSVSQKDTQIIVTFDPNGGQPVNLDESEYKVQENGLITKVYTNATGYGAMPTMEMSGFDFAGWYNLPSDVGIKIEDYSAFIDQQNHTLYAHYVTQSLTYSIRYKDIDTGIEVLRSESGIAHKGDIVHAEGKTVLGYSVVNEHSEFSKQILEKNTELIVYYKKNEYKIKYTAVIDDVKYTSSIVTTFKYGDNKALASFAQICASNANFNRLGYNFVEWAVGDVTLQDSYTITMGDLTRLGFSLNFAEQNKDTIELEAIYAVEYYTLTIYNGTSVHDIQVLPYNVSINEVSSPSKSGYNFEGWYENPTGENSVELEGNTKVNLDTFKMPANNVNIYAGYSLIEYTLEIELSGGKYNLANELEGSKFTSDTISQVTFTVADNFVVPVAIKNAYNFNGYQDVADENHRTKYEYRIINRVGDLRIVAIYTPTEYFINLDTNGGALISGASKIKYDIEKAVTLSGCVCTRQGYTFEGWTGEGVTVPDKNLSIPVGSYGDKSYIANYAVVPYSIEYIIDDKADAVVNPHEYNIETETITLNNPSMTGYRFIGWTKGESTLKVVEMRIERGSVGDLIFTAHFEPVEYKISLNLDGGSITGGSQIRYTIESEDITLNEASKNGYDFIGWTSDDVGNEILSPVKDVKIVSGSYGNRTFKANYNILEYDITYDYDGGDKMYGDYRTVYTVEDDFIPSKLQKEGFDFIGWKLYDEHDILLDGERIVKGSTGDRKFVAQFEPSKDTPYKVYHYKETLVDNEYVLYEEDKENLTGETGATIEVATKSFVGYVTPETESMTISAGGDSVHSYYYKRKTYAVQVVTNGAIEPIVTKEYKYEELVSVTAVAKTGYTFVSWSILPSTLSLVGSETEDTEIAFNMPSSAVVLTANAIETPYHIVVDYNDGYNEPMEIEYTYFSNAIVIDPVERSGYTFVGYSGTGIADGEYVQSITIPKYSTGDRTYQANWKIIEYTITYTLNGGECTPANPTKYTYEYETFTLVNPTRNGYIFIGWSGTGLNGNDNKLVQIEKNSVGNKAFEAHFEADDTTYIVIHRIMDIDGENYTEYDSIEYTGKVDSEVTGELLAIEGFTAPSSQAIVLSYDKIQNVITYNYARNKYDVVLEKALNDNGISELIGSGKFYYGSEVSISMVLNTGYDFDKWEKGEEEIVAQVFNVTIGVGGATYTGYTKPHTYTITYNTNDGIASGELITSYNIETSVNVPSLSKDGYIFITWQGADLTGENKEFTIPVGSTGDREYTAVFELIGYNLTYELNGGNTEIANPIGYNIESQDITLINPTKVGYTFTGWSGTDLVGDDNLVVVISTGSIGDRAYIAHYMANEYTIIYEYNGATGNNTQISKAVIFNTAYGELPTPTKTGYEFVGWYTTNEYTNEITSESILSSLDNFVEALQGIVIYAKYSANTYQITLNLENNSEEQEIMFNVVYGEEIVLPEDLSEKLVLKGVKFAGFYTQQSGGGELWISSTLEPQKQAYDVAGDTLLYAKWEVGKYIITLDAGELGTPRIQTREIQYNDAMYSSELQAPTRPGYFFKGFYTRENGGGSKYYTETMQCNKRYDFGTDLTLYAHWTPQSYTITLYRNARTLEQLNEIDNSLHYLYTIAEQTEEVTATFDANMPEATLPYIAGQDFVGYYDEPNGQGNKYYDNEVNSVRIWDKPYATTLYAYYTTHYYTVAFDYNVASGIKPSDTAGSTSVSQVELGYDMPTDGLQPPTRTGYTFMGYYDNAISGTMYYNADMTSAHIWDKDNNSVTLYARWQVNTYTITYNSNYGTEQTVSDEVTYDHTFTTRPIETFIRTGYTQTNWSEDRVNLVGDYQEMNTSYMVVTATDLTEYAIWEANVLYFDNQTLNGGIYSIGYTTNAFTGARNGTGDYRYEVVHSSYRYVDGEQVVIDSDELPSGIVFNATDRTFTISSTVEVGTYIITVLATDNDSGSYTTALITFSIERVDLGIPEVSISNQGIVTWLGITGATSYEISIDGTNYSVAESGVNYLSTIVANTGTRTVYVRALSTNRNYNEVGEAGNASVVVVTMSVSISNVNGGIARLSRTSSITYETSLNFIDTAEVYVFTVLNPGYEFVEWENANGNTTKVEDTISADTKIIASTQVTNTYTSIIRPIVYTIHYDYNVGDRLPSGGSYEPSYTIEDGDYTPSDAVRTGYVFTHWDLYDEADNLLAGQAIVHGSIGDRYYVARYTPNLDTAYKVNHYFEEIDGDTGEIVNGKFKDRTNTLYDYVLVDNIVYTLRQVDNLTGTSDTIVTPDRIVGTEGFTVPVGQAVNIDADGTRVVNYYYTRNIHSVAINVVDAGIASTTGANNYKYGKTIQVSVIMETGYTFNGWHYTPENVITLNTGYNFNDETIRFILPDEDIVFSVKGVVTVYTITFNDVGIYPDPLITKQRVVNEINRDGQSNSISATNVSKIKFTYFDDDFTVLADSRIGYTFNGWSISGGALSSTFVVDAQCLTNLTYTANWTRDEYAISYNWKLASGTNTYAFGTTDRPADNVPIAYNSGNPSSYNYETATFSLVNPTRENFTFKGWLYDDLTTPVTNVVIANNTVGAKSYTAVFEPNKVNYYVHYLKMNMNGEYVNTQENWEEVILSGDVYSRVTPIVNTYSGFVARMSDTDNTVRTQGITILLSPIAENNIVTYYYSRNTHTLTLSTDVPNGVLGYTLSKDNANHTYYYGEVITITPDLNPKFEFENWVGEGFAEQLIRTSPITVTINGDVTLRAFALEVYTIQYVLHDGVPSSTLPTRFKVTSQDITINQEITRTGYTWNGWSGTGLTGTPKVISIPNGSTGDRVYEAEYTANTYTVTLLDNMNNTTSYVTAIYDSPMPTLDNDSNILVAPTYTGYTFGGYYTGQNGTGDKYYNTDMTSARVWHVGLDTTLYAYWIVDNYIITFAKGIGIAEIFANTEANVNIKSASGSLFPYNRYVYLFVRLESNNAQYSYASPIGYTAYVSGDTTYYYKRFTIEVDNVHSNPNKTNDLGVVDAVRTVNQYTVTIVSANESLGTVSINTIPNVYYGTSITSSGNKVTVGSTEVTASVYNATGYTTIFASWTNGDTTLVGNTIITANFTRVGKPYTISYNLNGGNFGASHPTAAVYGTAFTVNNPTWVNHYFVGWTITGMDSVLHTYGTDTTSSTSISSTTATTFNNLHSTNGNVTFTANWELMLGVENTTSYYYYNGSLYSLNGTAYYNCSYCSGIITQADNSVLGCTGHTHNYRQEWYCTHSNCKSWYSYNTHRHRCSVCDGARYGPNNYLCPIGNVECGKCGGRGYTEVTGTDIGDWHIGIWVDGCSDCGGSGHATVLTSITYGRGYVDCSSCTDGYNSYLSTTRIHCTRCDDIKVTEYHCSYCDGWFETTSHRHGTVICSYCNGTGKLSLGFTLKCPSCNGTGYSDYRSYFDGTSRTRSTLTGWINTDYGCYHSCGTRVYRYDKVCGSGEQIVYLTTPIGSGDTGYYWSSLVGALKVGVTFTYSGSNYTVRRIENGNAYSS